MLPFKHEGTTLSALSVAPQFVLLSYPDVLDHFDLPLFLKCFLHEPVQLPACFILWCSQSMYPFVWGQWFCV